MEKKYFLLFFIRNNRITFICESGNFYPMGKDIDYDKSIIRGHKVIDFSNILSHEKTYASTMFKYGYTDDIITLYGYTTLDRQFILIPELYTTIAEDNSIISGIIKTKLSLHTVEECNYSVNISDANDKRIFRSIKLKKLFEN